MKEQLQDKIDYATKELEAYEPRDILFKANGLSSSTKFQEFDYPNTGITQEWHEHPETGELVIMDTWYIPNGEDDVDHDFEVIKVYPRVGCMLAKENLDKNKLYEAKLHS
jgi:hypothetical protein